MPDHQTDEVTHLTSTVAVLSERAAALQRAMDDRDVWVKNQFQAVRENIVTALAAQKELVSSNFAASEKAIVEARLAQKETNDKNNEFRQQLKDQNDTMIPRLEAAANFKAMELRAEESIKNINLALDEIRKNVALNREATSQFPSRQEVATMLTSINKDVQDLREFRSSSMGSREQAVTHKQSYQWVIGLGLGLLFSAVSMLLSHLWK